MPKIRTKLNKENRQAVADGLARFFFNYWQKQSINSRGGKAATLAVGSSLRGGSPAARAAT